MFNGKYFGTRYFADKYWAKTGNVSALYQTSGDIRTKLLGIYLKNGDIQTMLGNDFYKTGDVYAVLLKRSPQTSVTFGFDIETEIN